MGVFSFLYHICPTQLVFQFDSSYMFFAGVFLLLNLYYKRHTLSNRPLLLYGILFIFLVWNFVSIITQEPLWFWIITCIAYIIFTTNVTLAIYGVKARGTNYVTNASELIQNIKQRNFTRQIKTMLIVMVVNWSLIIIVAATRALSYSLTQLIAIMFNALCYHQYYVYQKKKHGEHISWTNITLDYVSVALMLAAFYFFNINVSDKAQSPEVSRSLNRPCVLFGFYDDHDVWHFLASYAIGVFILAVQVIDIDLIDTRRESIISF